MIGQLIHRIIIKGKIKVPDGRGGFIVEGKVGDWPIIDTVWAAVSEMDASEIQRYQAIYPEINTKILIRYNTKLDEDYIIEHDGKIYEILGYINPMKKNTINLIAAKGVPRRGKYEPDT